MDELPDNRMIREGMGGDPWPAWLYLALVAVVAALLWGGGNWVYLKQKQWSEGKPYLQVSNRDFSLFLWQFPEYMRVNVSAKTGYLPGFQYVEKVAIEPGLADNVVVAPPEALFLYHTWDRLIRNEFAARPIGGEEFKAFLDYAPEWQPNNWKEAPEEYKSLVASLDEQKPVSLKSVPRDVQQAFIGWKNFYIEGKEIEKSQPTYEELQEFLKRFPHYARNYWRNIVMRGRPDYLKTSAKGVIPEKELTAFLKVALFNYAQAKKGL